MALIFSGKVFLLLGVEIKFVGQVLPKTLPRQNMELSSCN
jgi:hypothetical protein